MKESPFGPPPSSAKDTIMITTEDIKALLSVPLVYSPTVREALQELLERREKDPKPKPVKCPVDDETIGMLIEYAEGDGLDNTALALRELLEYRRLTRRTHYQEGDFITNGAASQALVATRCQQIVGWDMHNQRDCCLIPLSSFAHLHHD
jgi:hypothetical protein